MNDPSQMLMNRGFGIWPPPWPEDPMGFYSSCRLPPPFAAPGGAVPGRVMNWKAKKLVGHRKKAAAVATGGVPLGGGGIAGGYNPAAFQEFQYENRVKARRFYSKKKFVRSAPFAPRNTTSFLIRAKKSGGIAPLVSPCPVTPAVLPTPELSPTREDLADLVKEEWGVDGYGSMKGLIRLRWPSGHETRPDEEEDGNEEETSSESDVEEHLEVERRLDHDVSRFEMVYPVEEHSLESVSASELLEGRVNDQGAHIALLEEENITLKGRLFRLDREVAELKKRVLLLESIHADNKNTNGGNDVEEECSERSSGAAMAD
ncbi:uncharacterized protein LOC122012297 [Zingiber officinale]|uniref:PRLI-interacting factor A n=1 Tax=Zingiber officinale TaxID=94328 RepID=A0A8J5IPD8_ZINOF|nr:uncharacterized protein LOC122012297 [Zingiber officinale]KAG6538504.1 hypothetical protein ZIOFF_003627 [Zingiber officinale]